MQSIPPPRRDPNRIACIGESQGYTGLHVHYGVKFDHAYEKQTPCLTTAYIPTDEQRGIIAAGGAIVIELINVVKHPPIMVSAEPL